MNPSAKSQNPEVELDFLTVLGNFSGFIHLFTVIYWLPSLLEAVDAMMSEKRCNPCPYRVCKRS